MYLETIELEGTYAQGVRCVYDKVQWLRHPLKLAMDVYDL